LGYSTSAANRHIQVMAHLDRRLVREGLDVAVLATERVESFFRARREAGYVEADRFRRHFYYAT